MACFEQHKDYYDRYIHWIVFDIGTASRLVSYRNQNQEFEYPACTRRLKSLTSARLHIDHTRLTYGAITPAPSRGLYFNICQWYHFCMS
jgi:phosphatidylethanolamine-binding protein (PEBP) family uncharacterized protein